jgi:pyridoxal phosphate enzyme (YggS family)
MSGSTYRTFLNQVAAKCRTLSRTFSDVTLVAVSKGHPLSSIQSAHEAGARDFGENRVPELLIKMESAPDDIRWHFIGTLQQNKVRKLIGKCALIHSVDSLQLCQKIGEASVDLGVTTNLLLQVNVSGEASKHGFFPKELKGTFLDLAAITGVRIQGLMTMAPFTEDATAIRDTFRGLRELRDELCELSALSLPYLSMGMTHDWEIALEEGATHLRVGTAIFGCGGSSG